MPYGNTPFPFGNCRICNDRASGVHYGLATCDGCKGFFKRSISKADKYKCYFGSECLITPQTRNGCRSCRFKKCLDLGMSFEAVKMGRIPKIEKQRALEAAQNPTSCQIKSALENVDTELVTIMNPNKHQSPLDDLPCSSESMRTNGNLDSVHLLGDKPRDAPGEVSPFRPIPESDESSGFQKVSDDGNMNLLADAAIWQRKSDDHPDQFQKDVSSSGRSLYSPGVIKVLFDQVAEMTGPNQVSDVVMQTLVKKCIKQDDQREWSMPRPNSEWHLSGPATARNGHTDYWSKTPDLDPVPSVYTQESHFHSSLGPGKMDFRSDEMPQENTFPSTDSSVLMDLSQNVYSDNPKTLQMNTFTEGMFQLNINESSGESQQEDLQLEILRTKDGSPSCWLSGSEKLTDFENVSLEKVKFSSVDELVNMGETCFDYLVNKLSAAYEDRRNSELRQFVQDFFAQKMMLPVEEITEETTKDTWNQLFKSIPVANARIIGFCNIVPGFSLLNVEDQKILLKRSYYDIWMLTNSEFFIDGECYLRFLNGRFYSRMWMEHIIKKENAKLLFDFAESFNKLSLSDMEIAVIATIQLTSPGHDEVNLQDAVSIQKLNSLYLNLLVHVVSKHHPDLSSRILVDIFRHMPQLAEITKMQQSLIANLTPPS